MTPNSVKQCRRNIFLLALFALSCGSAASADPETDQLRAENLRLKAQLQAMQQSCAASAAPNAKAAGGIPAASSPVAAATGSAATGAAAVVPASPATAALAPASAGKPAPVSQIDPQAAVVTVTGEGAAATAIPQGYKLVPINTPSYIDPLAPPYDRTGCSREMFAGPPPAKWNDAENWRGIYRGESMAEVEQAVGKEHFDRSSRGRVEWQYGKCGSAVSGSALFEGGKLISWQVPDLD